MDLWEIKAEIPAASAEVAETVLLEVGLQEWSLLEDALAKRAWIIGIFEGKRELETQWAALRPLLGKVAPSAPVQRSLPKEDWRDSYKAHFKAWSFGRLHWVPLWEKDQFQTPEGSAVLWLDPGLAFGTGNHETTRLCIERLMGLDDRIVDPAGRQRIRVIDAGCGSGILALSAALLGYGSVVAFDNDPEAVRVSLENATLNGLDGRVHFLTGDLEQGLLGRKADILLANIQSDVLMAHGPILTAAVAPAGTLILSGILATEVDRVRSVFSAETPGWTIDSRTLGEWSDLQLVRPL